MSVYPIFRALRAPALSSARVMAASPPPPPPPSSGEKRAPLAPIFTQPPKKPSRSRDIDPELPRAARSNRGAQMSAILNELSTHDNSDKESSISGDSTAPGPEDTHAVGSSSDSILSRQTPLRSPYYCVFKYKSGIGDNLVVDCLLRPEETTKHSVEVKGRTNLKNHLRLHHPKAFAALEKHISGGLNPSVVAQDVLAAWGVNSQSQGGITRFTYQIGKRPGVVRKDVFTLLWIAEKSIPFNAFDGILWGTTRRTSMHTLLIHNS